MHNSHSHILVYYRCRLLLMSFFFFSSRRRHTRLQGDWSSDVCSSDLSFRAIANRCDLVADFFEPALEQLAIRGIVVSQQHTTRGRENTFWRRSLRALDRKSVV